MVKRAKVTPDTFEKKQSAIDKLVGNGREEPMPEKKPEEIEEEVQPTLQRTYKPTSLYLSDAQLDKLDDLAHDYKKRTGKRINRNDIVRALINQVSLEEMLRFMKVE